MCDKGICLNEKCHNDRNETELVEMEVGEHLDFAWGRDKWIKDYVTVTLCCSSEDWGVLKITDPIDNMFELE